MEDRDINEIKLLNNKGRGKVRSNIDPGQSATYSIQ